MLILQKMLLQTPSENVPSGLTTSYHKEPQNKDDSNQMDNEVLSSNMNLELLDALKPPTEAALLTNEQVENFVENIKDDYDQSKFLN